jgi:hypothetical protein
VCHAVKAAVQGKVKNDRVDRYKYSFNLNFARWVMREGNGLLEIYSVKDAI